MATSGNQAYKILAWTILIGTAIFLGALVIHTMWDFFAGNMWLFYLVIGLAVFGIGTLIYVKVRSQRLNRPEAMKPKDAYSENCRSGR